MSDDPRYCVLLTESPRLEVRPVSRPLAKLFKRPLIDITTHLRNVRGVAYRDQDEETARQIAAILDESGQPARVMRQDELIEIPPPMRVKRAAVFDDELVIWVPRTDEPVGVPYPQVALLSLGVIRLYTPELDLQKNKQFKEMVKSGIPEAREHLKRKIEDEVLSFGQSETILPPQTGEDLLDSKVGKLPLEYHLDIVLEEPFFVVRLTEHQFNFEDLVGASNSTLRNYHLLVTSIAERAGRAYLTPQTERFLAWETQEGDLFEDLREFESHTTWLIQTKMPDIATPKDADADAADDDDDDDDLDVDDDGLDIDLDDDLVDDLDEIASIDPE